PGRTLVTGETDIRPAAGGRAFQGEPDVGRDRNRLFRQPDPGRSPLHGRTIRAGLKGDGKGDVRHRRVRGNLPEPGFKPVEVGVGPGPQVEPAPRRGGNRVRVATAANLTRVDSHPVVHQV